MICIDRKERITFHCGKPGLYALAAVYYHETGNEEKR
jgi:hypothetical protein